MPKLEKTVSGQYINSSHNGDEYKYFVPNRLPPPLKYDNELVFLLAEAQRYLSELGVK